MTPADLKVIREDIGVSKVRLAYEMGYAGNRNTMFHKIAGYESGKKQPIPLNVARYIWLLGLVCAGKPIPMTQDGLPDWPDWPGYHIEELPEGERS